MLLQKTQYLIVFLPLDLTLQAQPTCSRYGSWFLYLRMSYKFEIKCYFYDLIFKKICLHIYKKKKFTQPQGAFLILISKFFRKDNVFKALCPLPQKWHETGAEKWNGKLYFLVSPSVPHSTSVKPLYVPDTTNDVQPCKSVLCLVW